MDFKEAYYYSVENSNFKSRPYDPKAHIVNTHVLMTKLMTYTTTQLSYSLGDAYAASQEIRSKYCIR